MVDRIRYPAAVAIDNVLSEIRKLIRRKRDTV